MSWITMYATEIKETAGLTLAGQKSLVNVFDALK